MTKVELRNRVVTAIASFSLIAALLISVVSGSVAYAAEAKMFDQTIEITQTISANPKRTSYTYRLRPILNGTPLPEGANNEYYEFVLTGNSKKSIPVNFSVEAPTNYQYVLERVEEVPEGDTVTPNIHHFGYKFEIDSTTGELVIIPYTCYDNHFVIWQEVDGNGNPTGITLRNWVSGKTAPSSATTTIRPSTASRTIYSSGNSSRFAKYVNTEDGSRIMFWGTMLLIATLGLLFLLVIKRHNREERIN